MFHQEPDHHHHCDEQEVHRVIPSNSTIRRTGRLLALSMAVSSSAFSARPPQPSWEPGQGCRGAADRAGSVVV